MIISSINLNSINKSVSGITETISKTKATTEDISKKIGDTNNRITNNISNSAKLFQLRRSAVKRRERESIIEASGIGGATRRIGRVLGESTKGFFSRVLEFLATIIVGWMVLNLPKIIKGVQDLIKRIQKFITIVTNFTNGLIQSFTDFGVKLSEIKSNILSFNLEPLNKRIRDIVTKLQNNFRAIENNFIREVNQFAGMTDDELIGKYSKEANEKNREALREKVVEQVDEDAFEKLPKNLQDAIGLLANLDPNFKLKDVDIEDINSGDIKNIETILREAGIIPYENDKGEIEYGYRENVENFKKNIDNLNDTQKELNEKKEEILDKLDQLKEKTRQNDADFKKVSTNPNINENLVAEKRKQTIVINSKNKSQNNFVRPEEKVVAFNSTDELNSKVFTDLQIQKILVG